LAAVAVAGVLATGGAAAAATGHLPRPVADAARRIMVTIGDPRPTAPTSPVHSSGPAASTPGAGGAGQSTQAKPPAGAAGPAPGSTAAEPNLQGLCQAYLDGNGNEQGKKLEASAFQALAAAAGGHDKVAAYCRATQPDAAKDEQKPRAPGDRGHDQTAPSSSTGNGGGHKGEGSPPPAATLGH
jgi:hypothetical protein